MPSFTYVGHYARVYPEIMTESGSLQVEPGDVRDLEEAPDDGYWVETASPAKPATAAKKKEG